MRMRTFLTALHCKEIPFNIHESPLNLSSIEIKEIIHDKHNKKFIWPLGTDWNKQY